MRLRSTVSGRFPGFRLDSDAFWNSHPGILPKGPRLRRVLDHPGGTAAPFAPQVGVLALAGAPPPVGAPPSGPNGAGGGRGAAADLRPPRLRRVAGCPPGSPQGCVSKSVRARGRRGSLETQPFLSPRFRPSSLLGALPSPVSHTRAGISKHRAAHNGGIKPLCATTCCVNPALVCVTGSSGRKGDRTRMTINWWAAPHEERPTGPQNQVLVSRTDWGGGRPARGGGAVPDPGRTSRAGPQPAGRQARPISPRPSA